MATKEELIAQIKNHEETIPKLESMLRAISVPIEQMRRDIPIQIEQLKATIELKKKALAEKES